jgi:hypothetical protein
MKEKERERERGRERDEDSGMPFFVKPIVGLCVKVLRRSDAPKFARLL